MRTPCFKVLEQRPLSAGRQYPEVPVRLRRRHAAPRRALEEPGLDQVRLVEVLERSPVLAERSRDGVDPDGTAAELLDDRREDPPVELVEPVLVDLQARERRAGRREIDAILPGDFGEVAQ